MSTPENPSLTPELCRRCEVNLTNTGICAGCAKRACELVVIDFDHEANASYVRFSTEKPAAQQDLGHGIILDIDADGFFVGIEVLHGPDAPLRDILTKIGDPWHHSGAPFYHCQFCGTTDPENHDEPRCPQPDINRELAR